MEKKQYSSPAMRVVKIQVRRMLADSVTGMGGNASVKYGGASSNDKSDQGVRSNGHRGIWDGME